jgi:glycosyltransferase involved in cell wall biosynthesis
MVTRDPGTPDLVLVGTTEDARTTSPKPAEHLIAELGLQARVHLLEKIIDDDLVALYNRAALTVVPSLYEGFGLTALEAMASGSPVVASNAGALPEVVGSAAILVDPTDPRAIADGIWSVLNDSGTQQRLRHLGLQRAASFTWSKSASALYSVLRSAAQ